MWFARCDRKRTREFSFSSTDESIILPIEINKVLPCEIVKLVITTPNWTDNVTTQIKMFNEDDKELFTTGDLNRNEEYDITLCDNECIILGVDNEVWKAVLSAPPGGTGGTITMTLYMRPW